MAVNKVETVDIVRDLVTLLVTELTGSGAWVENVGENTFTMPICKTYWLKAQDVITIDGTDYTISSVIRDTSVTVTTSVAPNDLTFFLEAPSFYHGTIVQTNQELSQDSKDVSERSPMAYLFRDLTDTFFDDSNLLDRETNIRLFFLHDTNFQDFTTDLADEETLEPMRSMAYFFVEEILKKSKLIGKIEDYDIRDYLKFGVENASGYTENIFNDNFSGVELTITLPILRKYLCECDDVTAKIKYIDSDSVLKSSNYGSLIVCTPSGASEINVSNSNDSYSVDTSIDLELPNINFTDSDGVTTSVPSMEDITATLIETTGAQPLRSGQTVSYATGDDADLDFGRDTSWFVLSWTNFFGNSQRFTGTTGGYYDQTLAGYYDKDGVATTQGLAIPNDVVIDWSTYVEKTNDFTMYVYSENTPLTGAKNWTTWLGLMPYTYGGYSDWNLLNVSMAATLCNFGLTRFLNWFPLRGAGTIAVPVFTSTTDATNSADAFAIGTTPNITANPKTNTRRAVLYRQGNTTEL